jgi:hypothetical protein
LSSTIRIVPVRGRRSRRRLRDEQGERPLEREVLLVDAVDEAAGAVEVAALRSLLQVEAQLCEPAAPKVRPFVFSV